MTNHGNLLVVARKTISGNYDGMAKPPSIFHAENRGGFSAVN